MSETYSVVIGTFFYLSSRYARHWPYRLEKNCQSLRLFPGRTLPWPLAQPL